MHCHTPPSVGLRLWILRTDWLTLFTTELSIWTLSDSSIASASLNQLHEMVGLPSAVQEREIDRDAYWVCETGDSIAGDRMLGGSACVCRSNSVIISIKQYTKGSNDIHILLASHLWVWAGTCIPLTTMVAGPDFKGVTKVVWSTLHEYDPSSDEPTSVTLSTRELWLKEIRLLGSRTVSSFSHVYVGEGL